VTHGRKPFKVSVTNSLEKAGCIQRLSCCGIPIRDESAPLQAAADDALALTVDELDQDDEDLEESKEADGSLSDLDEAFSDGASSHRTRPPSPDLPISKS
jgi:hypothetical protein